MHSTLLLMFVAAMFGAGLAIAQSGASGAAERKPPTYISKFDDQFKAADKDGDGALTRAEAENARMGRIVEHFDRIDSNRDGKVTRDEIRALVRNRLSS